MAGEADFIAALRALATDPSSRALMDDAAVLQLGGISLVLTHDMLVEGVHYLPGDPAEDVAWKLVAVNLSDLAAKGATPVGALLGYALGDEDWDRAFIRGLAAALSAFSLPLLGGDTVAFPAGAPRALGLTALGRADTSVPARSGANAGDHLWVSGTIGDAGAGLRVLRGELPEFEGLAERYRNPRPRLEAGQALAPLVSAMMDVSDGVLIDADRMAQASQAGFEIALDLVPLSGPFLGALGDGRDARLFAATCGDDYELLFAAPADRGAEILRLSEDLGLPLTRIGTAVAGAGLRLTDGGESVPLPASLGWEHG